MDFDELLRIILGSGEVDKRSLYNALFKYLMKKISDASGEEQYTPSRSAQEQEYFREKGLRDLQRELEMRRLREQLSYGSQLRGGSTESWQEQRIKELQKELEMGQLNKQIAMLNASPSAAQRNEDYQERMLRNRQRDLEKMLIDRQISMLGSYDFRRQEQDEQQPTFDQWLRWMQIRKREPQRGWMPKFRGGY